MLRHSYSIIALFCALSVAPAAAAEPAIDLRVLPGDWGDAPGDNIAAVCRSAAREILQHCGERKLEPTSVRHDKAGPMVIYGVGDSGERRILLNVRDTHWSQFAYQFSHEVCHVLCNYREAKRENQWFEESLCEAASLFALRSMAKTWRTNPPYSNWKGYSASLQSYADERMAAVTPGAEKSLAGWYRKHEVTLRKDPTNRALNQVVAVELLKLLEREPRHWQALAQLNQWPAEESLAFAAYLADWHSRVAEEHQPFVAAIAELFEIPLR